MPDLDPAPAEIGALTARAPATRAIAEAVIAVWPEHARYLARNLALRGEGLMRTTEVLAEAALALAGDRLGRIAGHYRWTCDRLREEELFFHREGRYRLSTFAEADREVYSDAAYMEKYMEGLLFSQVLWFNHAASCHFFLSETAPLLKPGGRYLEIGPGHGLMMYLALRDFRLGVSEAWDLSQVSLDQTRAALARLGQAGCSFAIQNVMEVSPGGATRDLVVLSEVLEHLEDPLAVMGRIRHLVNPDGGLVFVNVPINSPSPDHLYLMRDPGDARALLTGSGFEIVREGFFATQGMELDKALKNRVSVSACLLARPVLTPMLFNSLAFIFLFLPLALAGYHLLIRLGQRRWLFLYLVLVSLVFYAVSNLWFALLLTLSMLGNYSFSLWLDRLRESGSGGGRALTLGVLANLAVLGWFKYVNFFIDNFNTLGAGISPLDIALPLGISFYTFQQIGYLVDVARGEVRPGGPWRYATFVIFFPQLIAGPIVHYKEMMPQFFGRSPGRFPLPDLTAGLAIFAIGLAKKTLIADSAAFYSSPVYEMAAAGEPIGIALGWTAALAYTVQLYFDFSGYSDMAIGLGRMFGIRLPVNFHSPLRAGSIIDYWRRWHITLQQFIVAYMYQPLVLPLSRYAAARNLGKWPSFFVTLALPTVVLFTVIGLWHGAAWTFVIFGLMHGTYLATNEFWRAWRRKARRGAVIPLAARGAYHAVTLLAVIFANVMFRAESPGDAWAIWAGMLDFSTISQIAGLFPASMAEIVAKPGLFLIAAGVILFLCPNTQQIMGRYGPILHWQRWRHVAPAPLRLLWRPAMPWALATGFVFFLGVAFILRGQSEFIYFNF